ncbi:hypothetical protein ACIPZF_20730 [Pseudomonas sp. NPDC089752]|uniref:hypothetical protein n=1 Tax=Pseudomonas sp. NPDC089752 TaxID=3364472 RepID=UPI00380FFD18
MNRSTSAASAPFAGNASRCTKGFWARLRLVSMLPLLLGACVLLPATISPVHAKEFSMQDNQGQYQRYTPGMKLPDGVFPPMQGYTHEDLIGAAAKRAEAVMKADGIDPTLARESLFALAKYLNEAFEDKLVEYRISKVYQESANDPAERSKLVAQMAESCGAMAIRAATQSLRGSPLLNKDDAFLDRYTASAGDGVHDLIVGLNKPGA